MKNKFVEESLNSLKRKKPELAEIIDSAIKTRIIFHKRLDQLTKMQLETLINSLDNL